MMQVKFFYMDDTKNPGTPVPEIKRATACSAGYDLQANGDWVIPAHGWVAIPTGVRIKMEGFHLNDVSGFMIPEAQVRTRSGMALKRGLTVMNSPGTIDADYNGEIKVILLNHNNYDVDVVHGERIAQLVFSYVEISPESKLYTTVEAFEEATRSERGSGGFGSTGV